LSSSGTFFALSKMNPFLFCASNRAEDLSMYSKAKIGGHPIHPMIVGFPIVFYTLTFVGFAMYRFWSQDLFWYQLGYFSAFGGVITAVLAAIPGAIDWAFGIPKTSAAKTRGAWHALLNVGA